MVILLQEKFTDIVNWLKANSSNGEIKSAHGSQAALKTLESENKESDGRLSFPKPDTPVANSSSSFGASWNSGSLFSKTTPFSFGESSLSWMLLLLFFFYFLLFFNVLISLLF